MATIEERLQALEQEHEQLQALKREHAELKKTIELQTIAIRALASKEAFEKLQDTVEKIQETVETSQEQNGKLFNVLINHNTLTNERLGNLQGQLIETDGKVAGSQTEIRQTAKQTNARFDRIETLLTQVLERLP